MAIIRRTHRQAITQSQYRTRSQYRKMKESDGEYLRLNRTNFLLIPGQKEWQNEVPAAEWLSGRILPHRAASPLADARPV